MTSAGVFPFASNMLDACVVRLAMRRVVGLPPTMGSAAGPAAPATGTRSILHGRQCVHVANIKRQDNCGTWRVNKCVQVLRCVALRMSSNVQHDTLSPPQVQLQKAYDRWRAHARRAIVLRETLAVALVRLPSYYLAFEITLKDRISRIIKG